MSGWLRLMDRIPFLRRVRVEQQRRDDRTAELQQRASKVKKEVDQHADRVLRDYRDYGGALRR